MQLSQQRTSIRRISLTPLIDVVFLLLIFFMLSSTFLKFTAINIGGGQAGAGTGDISNLVLVRVHQNNKIEINGKIVTLKGLEQHLTGLAIKDTMHIVVKPMGGVTLQGIVDVIEQTGSETSRKVTVVK